MKKVFLAAFTALLLAACNDAATDRTTAAGDPAAMNTSNNTTSNEAKEERNKQTALASARAFENGGNVDVILKDMDKDAMDYGEGSSKPIKGVDSTKAMLKMWLSAMADYKGSDLMAVADGDYVMVYGTWSGTWKQDFMGMKPTGKSFKVNDVDIFKFNDAGKIIEHRSVQSASELARQVGMKMPTQ